MSRTTAAPPPITWDRDKLGTEHAKLDEHGTLATLTPTPRGTWWQIYWPPKSRKGELLHPRGSRQGNAANREDAIAAAFAAYHAGRP